MRKTVLSLAVLLLAGVATGCWNRTEIDKLGFVMILGVDKSEDGESFEVTAMMAKTMAMPTGGEGGGAPEKQFVLARGTGKTLFEAIRNTVSELPRQPFLAHMRLVIIGEDTAREGINEILDPINRAPEPRRTAILLVARDAKAHEVMEGEFALEGSPSEGIMSIMRGEREWLSSVTETNLNAFLISMEEEGVEPALGVIGLVDRGEGQQDTAVPKEPGESLMRERILKSPILQGTAVFKNDKLVGWLDKAETRGYLWITGEVRGGIINVQQPGTDKQSIGMEILRAKTELQVKMNDQLPGIGIKISVEANVGEVQGRLDPFKDPEMILTIERSLEKAIKSEIQGALTKIQNDLKTDILGFGMIIWRRHPKEWLEKYRPIWDEVFPRLQVDISVNAVIRRSGLTTRSTDILAE